MRRGLLTERAALHLDCLRTLATRYSNRVSACASEQACLHLRLIGPQPRSLPKEGHKALVDCLQVGIGQRLPLAISKASVDAPELVWVIRQHITEKSGPPALHEVGKLLVSARRRCLWSFTPLITCAFRTASPFSNSSSVHSSSGVVANSTSLGMMVEAMRR